MLKLKLWPPDAKSRHVRKEPMLGKIEGRRRRGWQRTRWLDGITDSMDMSLNMYGKLWRTRKPAVLSSMGLQRIRHDWALNTATMYLKSDFLCFWDQDVKDAQPEWSKAGQADSLLTIVTCFKGAPISTQNCIVSLRIPYSAICLTIV